MDTDFHGFRKGIEFTFQVNRPGALSISYLEAAKAAQFVPLLLVGLSLSVCIRVDPWLEMPFPS
jgi:hypothetical protein